jgi:hypothetical protein
MRCDEMFCDDCWSKPKKHRKPEPGHDQTIPNDAIIVHSTLKVRLDEWGLLEDAMKRSPAPNLHQLVGDSSEWFGVRPKNEAGDCSLVEGLAYDLMVDSFWTSASGIYPGLVSFVGETGASCTLLDFFAVCTNLPILGSGKSSLISLLSKVCRDLSSTESVQALIILTRLQFSDFLFRNQFKTPAVGESGSRQSTSSNVHLYADPQTFLSENPILYADCEGIDGDEIPTEMTKALASASAPGDPLSDTVQSPELDSQDIAWSKKPRHSGAWTRREITKTLFPRILYIFSDVVVFIPFNRM